MNESSKKVTFYSIVIIVSIITLYLIINTVYINLTSYSRGLVHWHADLEIIICGEEIKLKEAESSFSNKVGGAEVHHHEDMRIHVEGVVNSREEATLGYFFDSIKEDFTQTSILRYENDYVCQNTGRPGSVKMFVNNIQNYEFKNYEISHYTDIPPGDKIKIIFD